MTWRKIAVHLPCLAHDSSNVLIVFAVSMCGKFTASDSIGACVRLQTEKQNQVHADALPSRSRPINRVREVHWDACSYRMIVYVL